MEPRTLAISVVSAWMFAVVRGQTSAVSQLHSIGLEIFSAEPTHTDDEAVTSLPTTLGYDDENRPEVDTQLHDDLGGLADTTSPSGNSSRPFMAQVQQLWPFQLATGLRIYVYPVLIPFGVVGNTLTVLVILQKHNRAVSSSLYLAMLAISDNFVLLTLAYAWTINNLFSGLSFVQCTAFVTILYTGTFNGMLLILSLTVDRFIAVCYPLQIKIYGTRRRVLRVGALSLIISLLINSPHIWLTQVENSNCIAYGDGTPMANVYSWVGIVLNSIFPFLTLLTLNTAILVKYRVHTRWFASIHGTGNLHDGSERQTQMTRLLVTVSLTFLALTLPMYVRHVYYQFVDVYDSPQAFATYALMYHVTQKLYFTNNAINFVLYCLGGSKFRPDLRRLLTCSTPKDVTSSTGSTEASQSA